MRKLNWKKTVAVSAALALCAGVLAGCGAASIELKVISRNRDALRLYASLGFCETKKYMALPLSQNGSK